MELLGASDYETVLRDGGLLYPFRIVECPLRTVWTTKGIPKYDGKWSLCVPDISHLQPGWVQVSHVVLRGFHDPSSSRGVPVLVCVNDPRFAVPVVEYALQWTDAGTRADGDCSVWKGVSPAPNEYVVMGDVVSGCKSDVLPPAGTIYAVRREFLVEVPHSRLRLICDDKGTKAKVDGSFWSGYMHVSICIPRSYESSAVGPDRVFWPTPVIAKTAERVYRMPYTECSAELTQMIDWDLRDVALNRRCVLMTHNSSALKKGTSFVANQQRDFLAQLHDGVRGFKLPIQFSFCNVGKEVARFMSSTMLKKRASSIGNQCAYVCHSGGISRLIDPSNEPLADFLRPARGFLDDHPDTVLLFALNVMGAGSYSKEEIHNTIAAAFEDAGLTDEIYEHSSPCAPWPSQASLVASLRRRIVVFIDEPHSPIAGLLFTKCHLIESRYKFCAVSEFNVDLDPEHDTPTLLSLHEGVVMLHHYLLGIASGSPSLAAQANEFRVLEGRIDWFMSHNSLIPSILQVDFYDIGDCFAAVNKLNYLWMGLKMLKALLRESRSASTSTSPSTDTTALTP
eukprot:ANDGO_01610.mRNA.1 hypothetical protein